jgi:hypothetical protein
MTAGERLRRRPHPELRDDHDLVAATAERPAEELLRLPVAVEVGGVEERRAGLEGRGDDLTGPMLVDPASEVVATDAGDRHRNGPDRAHLHPPMFPGCGMASSSTGLQAAWASRRRRSGT